MKPIYLAFLLMLSCVSGVFGADTAQQTLDKCVSRLKTSPGLSADFTISRQGRSVSGKIKEKGQKFSIVTPSMSTWYDGKSLFTWNSDNNEISVVSPTAEDLASGNPLRMLSSSSSYSVAFGSSKSKTQKVLVLTPKRRGLSAKKIIVTLAAASLLPQRLDVTLADGKTMTVTLKNISLKAHLTENDFKLSGKYRGAKVVDLR